MPHNSEEWCKIWRKTDLLFQKWQEFGEFCPECSKVWKSCTLIGSYCAKYKILGLKTYWGVIFHDTEEPDKIWRKADLRFGKWHEEFGKFSPKHSKIKKMGFWWDPFTQSRKCRSLKLQGSYVSWQWRMMQYLKRKIHFKIDMRNLTNFDPSTRKPKKILL